MIGFFTDIITPLLTILTLSWCFLTRPTHIRCPEDWHHDGVRPTGSFCCGQRPIGDPEWDGTWNHSPDRSTQPTGQICCRIYCTGGSRPIAENDGRTVACQRMNY